MVKSLLAMWETRVRSLGRKDSLEKEMATHSSILAWKIPWIMEPSRLQSTGLKRVRLYWVTSLSFFHSSCKLSFCDGSAGKEFTCHAGDTGDASLKPGFGRSPGGEKWQPTPVFLPGNSTDRGTWWAIVQRVAKSWTLLND